MGIPTDEPGDRLVRALERFGHSTFRPGQQEAIETLLGVGRLLLVAPTGGGKSLTYQLPAILLRGTTLVVVVFVIVVIPVIHAVAFTGTRQGSRIVHHHCTTTDTRYVHTTSTSTSTSTSRSR